MIKWDLRPQNFHVGPGTGESLTETWDVNEQFTRLKV